ncbi:MFS transporter [Salinibacterium sp. M195]|uniref:MFS transporter n=1 Tax=Salinibacterium sp. M195 TaxID=2583374 RepID=UPI001C629A2C|nr:MFS transporter [Salinibacterium sp. M195]QYH36639.1 MFS transporter [Salinibacterium sp. M195]
MSTTEPPFSWRSIGLPVLLPTLLFSIGEGAIIPLIPIAADNLGATLAIAGLVAALLTIGELFGNIPSGWLISRIGERPAMIGASALSIIGVVIAILAPNPIALGFGVLLLGLAAAVFALARHAFLTSFVPVAYRARALSTLGGTFRLGVFIGPFISAGIIHLTGTVTAAFWIHVIAALGAAAVLLLLPDPATTFGTVHTTRVNNRTLRDGEVLVEQESHGLFATVRRNRALLSRLGLGAAVIGAMRASRQVILPLWAVSIGLADTNTAIIIGIAGAVDFALFYTGGQIMDRFGRLWTAVPSLIGLGIGHLVLSFTHDVSTNVGWFIAAAMFLSLANGLGSGILMTLGADLAPRENPAPFLGAWRFTGGVGQATSPLMIAGITAVASISLAAGAVGVLGLIGAGLMLRYVPRYIPRPER